VQVQPEHLRESDDDNSDSSGGDEYSSLTAVCTTHDHHLHHGDYRYDR
jgi:hypothetical protein